MNTTHAINRAVVMTFANMAFVDAEPTPLRPQLSTSERVIGIEFLYPLGGCIVLHLPTSVKQAVVENIHGVDWQMLGRVQVDDCLTELVNIIAGTFLLLVEASEYRQALSAPQIWYSEPTITTTGELEEHFFLVNNEPAKVALSFAKAAASQHSQAS